MRYAEHIQQLQEHAARTAQRADTLVTQWRDAPPGARDYAAGQAAHGALLIADQAAQELRRAVRLAVSASVN